MHPQQANLLPSPADAARAMNDDGPVVERRRGMGTTKLLMPTWPANLVGQTDRPVRVLLVDPDAHGRLVLAQQLLADKRIVVTAQLSTAKEARRALLEPFDVLMVALNLPDGSGLDLVAQARTQRPGVESIVVSCVEDEHVVVQALEAGANGYLLKNSWFDSAALAVLQVVNGGAALSPNLARRLARRLGQPAGAAVAAVAGAATPHHQPAEPLSAREKDVLRQLATGCTSAEAGARLAISALTVDTHVKNIYRKLQVRSRAQAVSCAASRGWI